MLPTSTFWVAAGDKMITQELTPAIRYLLALSRIVVKVPSMPSDYCPYSASVAAKLADPAAHLDTELVLHLPSCEACRRSASAAVRDWPTDRSPSPSLAEWLSGSAGRATVISPFQAEQLARGQAVALELGPYLLLDRLGAGGMGEVYRARHRILRREDAVKALRPEIAGNAGAVKRFLREAEAVAKLHHPNVVHVYTADRAGASYYLAMEYVPGTDLGKFVRARGPLPIPLACEFVRQAAEGLQHAFAHGLVHRDIKPGNLLLQVSSHKVPSRKVGEPGADVMTFDVMTFDSQDFTVKVADFGLARAFAPGDASEMTAAGAVLGTADYIAPEQAQDARAADTRSDVYSLGCTLYHLLAGAVPFPGGSAVEKMIRHATAPVPAVAALRPDVPAALAAVVRKCLAKRPEERYSATRRPANSRRGCSRSRAAAPPHPAAPALDIPEVDEEDTAPRIPPRPTRADTPERKASPAPPKPTRRDRRWVWVVAGVLAVAVLATVAAWLASGPRKADPPKPVPTPDDGPPRVPSKANGPASWAFVGACRSDRKGKVCAVGFLADGAVVAGREAFAEDGTDAGYWEVWPKTGGAKPLRAARPPGTMPWESPAAVQPSGAFVTELFRRLDPLTFEPLPGLSTDLSKYGAAGAADSFATAAPTGDGKFLAGGVRAGNNGKRKSYAALWEADTGKVRTAWETRTDHDIKALAADRTGDTVVAGTAEGQVFAHSTATGGGRVWSAPKTDEGKPDPVSAVAVSPDGKTVYSAHDMKGIFVWKADQEQPATTLPVSSRPARLVVSPDGRWLVAVGCAVTVWDLSVDLPTGYELAGQSAGDLLVLNQA